MRLPTLKRCKAAALAAAIAGLGLTGCAAQHLSPDFGVAVRQDLAAQVADPDARYTGDPAPGSSGARVGLAQKRYQSGTVIAPVAASAASDIGGGQSAPAQAPAP
ncbi:hypothetical protein [Phenylobacterium sp.]|uniref:hypothetical protein n=1 Tax=Phenylobacterium sp. TaxID=1871053 RepID=UPI002F3F19CF